MNINRHSPLRMRIKMHRDMRRRHEESQRRQAEHARKTQQRQDRLEKQPQVWNASFSPPETITQTTTSQQADGKKNRKRTVEQKPVSARFTMVSERLQGLLNVRDNQSVQCELTEGQNKSLVLNASYIGQETRSYESSSTRACGQRWVEPGYVYYSWSPGHFETEYESVPVTEYETVDVPVTARINLSEPKQLMQFFDVLAGLKNPPKPIQELTAFLKTAGVDVLKSRIGDAKAKMADSVKAAEALLKEFTAKTAKVPS